MIARRPLPAVAVVSCCAALSLSPALTRKSDAGLVAWCPSPKRRGRPRRTPLVPTTARSSAVQVLIRPAVGSAAASLSTVSTTSCRFRISVSSDSEPGTRSPWRVCYRSDTDHSKTRGLMGKRLRRVDPQPRGILPSTHRRRGPAQI